MQKLSKGLQAGNAFFNFMPKLRFFFLREVYSQDYMQTQTEAKKMEYKEDTLVKKWAKM